MVTRPTHKLPIAKPNPRVEPAKAETINEQTPISITTILK
jgi:hypothetical protein